MVFSNLKLKSVLQGNAREGKLKNFDPRDSKDELSSLFDIALTAINYALQIPKKNALRS
jgi:hypothetical protein